MTKLYDKALAFATKAHAGQKRKFTGEPAITHPVAVAGMVEGEDVKVVALLHDVVEDTEVTLDDLAHEFPCRITDAIDHLTRWIGDCGYAVYIRHVSWHPLARRVKIEDLKHNLSTLPTGHSLEKRYRAALKVLEGVEELEVAE